jgi:prepilin-type N-terminal cleavage/methylation domain-containing protein
MSTTERLSIRLRRARARGFTLVELMISMVAGLIIASAAFLLARNSSSFFQHEAGISTAQFSALVGFSRLQADIRRASFLGVPNVQTDPKLCGTTGGWPVGMGEIAGLRLEQGGSVVRHGGEAGMTLIAANGLDPDAAIVGGAFGTTEQYWVDAIVAGGGGGYVVQLQNDGAMVRTLESGGDPNEIFRAGRYLRIVDAEGWIGFGLITGVQFQNNHWRVLLSANPALPKRETMGTCGCSYDCVGVIASPVTRMLYDVREVDVATYPQYKGLYATSTHGLTAQHKGIAEAARSELVRVELDSADAEIPATLEILAEYAVDLKFGIVWEQNAGVAPLFAPQLQRLAMGSNAVYQVASSLVTNGTPERIRAVQVRMSVRAPKRDRDQQIQLPPSGGLFRFSLGPNLGFARMRTLVADVQLVNQTRTPQ